MQLHKKRWLHLNYLEKADKSSNEHTPTTLDVNNNGQWRYKNQTVYSEEMRDVKGYNVVKVMKMNECVL